MHLYKIQKNDIYNWITNTTNNVVSSIIASVLITLFLGIIAKKTDTNDSGILLYIGVFVCFIMLSIIFFLLTGYFVKKKYKPIKAIVFDFDGTLSRCMISEMNSSWEMIWEKLGYKKSECEELYKKFKAKEINHQQWCDKTCRAFQKKNLTENTLKEIAKDFELIRGVKESLERLKLKGIKLYLVSGSIMQLIRFIWDDELDDYFDECKANIFRFKDGKLETIVGTRYDFEGKAKFITDIFKHLKLKSQSEILFIGNSDNDQYAHKSGARTLCLNAKLTNPDDKDIWDDSFKTDDFEEFLDYIDNRYYFQ